MSIKPVESKKTKKPKKDKVTNEERTFGLILALVASPNGLTKQQLLSSVVGYTKAYAKDPDSEALGQLFERDKRKVRSLGIPIETLDSPLESGNNQLTRYRISKQDMVLPSDIRFDQQELTLLRAAALAWSETSISPHSRLAIMKLESIDPQIDHSNFGVAPRVFINDSASQHLFNAIHNNKSAKFYYQKSYQEKEELRRVTPYRLHRSESRWHLIAYDHDKNDWRIFLVNRIVGIPSVVKRIKDIDREHEVAENIARLEALRDNQETIITVKNGSLAHSRLRSRGKESKPAKDHSTTVHSADSLIDIKIKTLDYGAFAEELVLHANEIVDIQPKILREKFKSTLQRMFGQHQ